MKWEIPDARAEIMRLAQLQGFPHGEENKRALEELVLVLFHNAKNTEHAKEVVSEWLEEFTTAPKPADLRRMLLRDDEKVAVVDGCSLCSQPPHRRGWLHVSSEGNGTSVRCVCRGGNPQLAEQARHMTETWKWHPLGNQNLQEISLAELQQKIKSLAKSKFIPEVRISKRATEMVATARMGMREPGADEDADELSPLEPALRERTISCTCQIEINQEGLYVRVLNKTCLRHGTINP